MSTEKPAITSPAPSQPSKAEPSESQPTGSQRQEVAQFSTAFIWAATLVVVSAVAYGIYLAIDVLVVLLLAVLFAILLSQVGAWINSHLSTGYKGRSGSLSLPY